MTDALTFTIPGPPRGQARPRFASRGRGGAPLPFVRTYSAKEDTSYAALVQHHALVAIAARRQETRAAQSDVSLSLSGNPGASPTFVGYPLTGPVGLIVRVVQKMPGPIEWKLKRKLGTWSTTKPDLSNVLKLIEDALIGIAYVDDKQVAQVTIQKRIGDQGEAARVEVEIEAAK